MNYNLNQGVTSIQHLQAMTMTEHPVCGGALHREFRIRLGTAGKGSRNVLIALSPELIENESTLQLLVGGRNISASTGTSRDNFASGAKC